ncbi:TlpA disulfide reductase family protein [Terriglobus sp. RCC_193]|uniref:TlpA disulfide reductase family protein n=1 Tax=Terriglobus sp. RCC_193 TaxID=3239218 RepID=UPI003523B239
MTTKTFTTALIAVALTASIATAQRPARHWAGTAVVTNNGDDITTKIPVELDLSAPAKNGSITGTFLNGDLRSPSSRGTLTGSHLKLQFHSFARTLEGDIHGDTFTGTFGGARIKKPYAVTLHRDANGRPATVFAAASKATGSRKGAAINGTWEIALPNKSEKGEDAWTMTVAPFRGDGEIRVVIQRIDGDSGALFGRFDEAAGEYHVSRFGDFGATGYTIRPNADGTLQVTNQRDPKENNVARRPEDARKEKLAPPTEATEQTTLVNPAEPLRFQGPNLTGQTISSTDAEFKGKVVIVAIGGSWCPNCHDEAPMLVELYNKYHQRGLEVVELSFEEGDQLKNPERLRAFVTKYKIPYTVLLMGTPDDLNDRLPQGKNLNAWPTSFFIGRDGLVKQIHAGFSGPATGQAYVDLRKETFALVEKLLAEPAAR